MFADLYWKWTCKVTFVSILGKKGGLRKFYVVEMMGGSSFNGLAHKLRP